MNMAANLITVRNGQKGSASKSAAAREHVLGACLRLAYHFIIATLAHHFAVLQFNNMAAMFKSA